MLFQWLRHKFSWSHGKYILPFPESVPLNIANNSKEKTHVGKEKFAVDFLLPEGTSVLAANDGVVALVVDYYDVGGPQEKYADKANHLVISHGEEFSFYFHLAFKGVLVAPGEIVKSGQLVAFQGSTGYTTEPHLHFAVYRAGSSVRPRFSK